ncbi:hypothetical protein VNI00_019204 [Paramarasmius palmivorus]|uniref:Uncharacterized protein n=1 Tax=Paramarasmius palmivorus TaxID=297713 RepID=A0AAW0APY2_9AGAR
MNIQHTPEARTHKESDTSALLSAVLETDKRTITTPTAATRRRVSTPSTSSSFGFRCASPSPGGTVWILPRNHPSRRVISSSKSVKANAICDSSDSEMTDGCWAKSVKTDHVTKLQNRVRQLEKEVEGLRSEVKLWKDLVACLSAASDKVTSLANDALMWGVEEIEMPELPTLSDESEP